MDSNYASLGSYYGKKNTETFEYSSTYNVGKFDIVKYSDSMKFQITDVDPLISSSRIQGIFPDGQLIIKADMLPDNFEIKTIDVFNNEAGVWVHNTIPLSLLYKYITYDNKKKEIYIGAVPTVPGTRAEPLKALQSFAFAVNRTKSPSVSLVNNKIVGSPFARVYITW
jgi:hypothetical protein